MIYSVTRLGDLLQFGQLFKACGNNYFAKIANILGNLCKVVKIFYFSSQNHFWATFTDIWQLFTGHAGDYQYLPRSWASFLAQELTICTLRSMAFSHTPNVHSSNKN